MVNVYDKAYELARALKASPEFLSYTKIKEKLEKDKETWQRIVDFRQKQLEIQARQLQGQKIEEELSQLQNLFNLLAANRDIAEFFQAEYAFSRLMFDIQKIIGEAVGLDMDWEKQMKTGS
ncbi:MAG: YlbF family regulator [Bacillota bacterium]|uniref:UPF0342 protein SAMN02745885_00410 n=2 Tax=Carboxydocella TaxID=178898 RepID=A0A1T4M430_9FIRM|nr:MULTISPECIES: YlbF family regulator [Carboxydocella]AVX21061.1 Cell fate regulator YlbF, YheA/YmcA/DUF963 family [Carboxydocella thermautotrophica]AVX31481.1 Cell fate regulator YlbF, YheA/YmcA/DUF963 family [Carboxydocella thermautotrophica]SJZ61538.1 Cell fate regulator YlbF, YheA/YmcA/DUF963 family (controls sporulation, competence, biofilm development) [Carboxydocella sporoproducens DSM 16521]GAW28817.1 hypothetical protein ULO1_13870 [Carboxydocella sp. ULO1]GAW32279.1 hypothetical pro